MEDPSGSPPVVSPKSGRAFENSLLVMKNILFVSRLKLTISSCWVGKFV